MSRTRGCGDMVTRSRLPLVMARPPRDIQRAANRCLRSLGHLQAILEESTPTRRRGRRDVPPEPGVTKEVTSHLAAVLKWLHQLGSLQTVERFQFEKRRDRWVLYRRLADHSYPCDEETFRGIASLLDRDPAIRSLASAGRLPPRKIAEAAGLAPEKRPQVGVARAFLKAVEESRAARIHGSEGRCSPGTVWHAWEEVRSRGGLWRHAKLGWILSGPAEHDSTYAAEHEEGTHAGQDR